MRAVEHELAIDVVFDHRDIGAAGDPHESLALVLRHDGAEWVRDRRRHHQRADGLRADDLFERRDVETRARVRRDLQRTHAEPFDRLQHAEVRRRLDSDHVTGTRHGTQPERQRFGRADRRADVALRQRHAGIHCSARDLTTQREQAGRSFVARADRGHLAHDLRDDAVQRGDREIRLIDRRAAERHELRISHRLEDLRVDVGDRDARWSRTCTRRARLSREETATSHEVSRLGSHLDQPGVLEPEIRLEHRRDADGALLREPPHAREPVARPQCSSVDRLPELVRQMLVEETRYGHHYGAA